MGRNDNFISGMLAIFIVLIFLVTVYFCLDIFGIIDVPEQYSLARFLGSNMVELTAAVDLEEIVTEQNIDEWINAKKKVEDDPIARDGGYEHVDPPVFENAVTNQSVNENNGDILEEELPKQQILYSNENVVNRMYYSQLDVYGKLIYLQFNEHREELQTGMYVANFGTDFNDLLHQENGDIVLENAFQLSMNSLMFDNPDLFYIDITKIFMSTEITTFGPIKTYRVKIGPEEGSNYLSDYFQESDLVIATNNTLNAFRYDFARELDGLTDYEKIKKIHDYIIDNTEYDQSLSRDNIYNIYGALMQHIAVCEGYSKAMKYLLDAANVPCVIVCGDAQNSVGESESHAWNYVKVDGAWYAVDCTWDDPLIIGDGYVSENIYTKYFLKGSRDFFIDHYESGNIVNDSNFAYPTISEENYIR